MIRRDPIAENIAVRKILNEKLLIITGLSGAGRSRLIARLFTVAAESESENGHWVF